MRWRWRILIALNVGVLGYFTGLIASALLNVPTGAAIVCTLVAVSLVAGLVVARSAPSRAEAIG